MKIPEIKRLTVDAVFLVAVISGVLAVMIWTAMMISEELKHGSNSAHIFGAETIWIPLIPLARSLA